MKMKQITKKMKYLNYLTKWSKPNNKQKKKCNTNMKKVEVSCMPGKTKVVQTLFMQD